LNGTRKTLMSKNVLITGITGMFWVMLLIA